MLAGAGCGCNDSGKGERKDSGGCECTRQPDLPPSRVLGRRQPTATLVPSREEPRNSNALKPPLDPRLKNAFCGTESPPDPGSLQVVATLPKTKGRGSFQHGHSQTLLPWAPGGFPVVREVVADCEALRRLGGQRLMVPFRKGAVGAEVLEPSETALGTLAGWRSRRDSRSTARKAGTDEVVSPFDEDRPEGPAVSEMMTTVRYRAVEFDVPMRWYIRWLMEWNDLDGSDAGGDLVSSTEECLLGAWPRFTAAIDAHEGLSAGNLDKVIGCYALESVADQSMFWRAGWGSHRRVLYYIMRMVVVYGDAIADEFQPSSGYATKASYCDGFSDFCRRVLRNQKAHAQDGDFCKLRINFDCADTRIEGETAEMPCDDGLHDSWTRNCGRYFNRGGKDGGREFDSEWDEWESSGWDPGYRLYRAVNDSATGPRLGAGNTGIGAGFSATFNPIQLAWTGFVCDRILHRARIAWDYYRYSGDATYARYARQLGRYALGPLLPAGRLMVHEVGHSYMGTGGHCEYGCCFETAALSWKCAVRGKLGVPPDSWSSGMVDFRSGGYDGTYLEERWQDDFGGDRTIISNEDDGCSSCHSLAQRRWWPGFGVRAGLDPSEIVERSEDAKGFGHLSWTCDIATGGQAGSESTFCLSAGWAVYSMSGVGAYRDDWDLAGCRPVITSPTEWRTRVTELEGGPVGLDLITQLSGRERERWA